MGVDCRIYLTHNVRAGDVAKVLGVLVGKATSRDRHNFLDVEGVSVRKNESDMAGCAWIDVLAMSGSALKYHFKSPTASVLFQYEGYNDINPLHGRIIIARSTAFWIAIGKRLVKFFGGCLYCADYSLDKPDYEVAPKPNAINCPEDGKPYWDLQKRIESLPPITEAEFKACDQFAAYKADGSR